MATKKYVCAFCARAFTRSEHKQRHERSHTNEKPFQCLHCTSAFVRRDLLQRHCRTVHNIFLNSSNFKKKEVKDGKDSKDSKDDDHPSLGEIHELSRQPHDKPSMTEDKPKDKDKDNYHHHANQNNQLINLLSISRKIYHLLVQFDGDLMKFNEEELNEIFLIGFIELSNNDEFPIIKTNLDNLIVYLNSNLINHNNGNHHHHQHQPSPHYHSSHHDGIMDDDDGNNGLNNFKLGLIYIILSIGFYYNNDFDNSIEIFNKSWNLLILKLIPINSNSDNSNNLINQFEILSNLFIINYIFLNYDFNQLKQFRNSNLNSDLMFNYLNDISFIILNNILINLNFDMQMIFNSNLNLFWSIYILLSQYYINKLPPKIFENLINQTLINDQHLINDQNLTLINNKSLKNIMINFSKNIIIIDSAFTKKIVVITLINEINYFKFFNKLLIFDSKNSLHNSIILINKSFIEKFSLNQNNNLLHDGGVSHNNNNDDDDNELFKIFKKKLIINCPVKFNDLLNYYIFQPTSMLHWQLLNISLKEFNLIFNNNFNFNLFINNNNSIDYHNFQNNLLNFYDFKNNLTEINNNLGIVSFPIIFNSKFLNKSYSNFNFKFNFKLSLFEKQNLNYLIIEWYLTLHKVIFNLFKFEEFENFNNNYIIQSILYLLNNESLDFKFNNINWYFEILDNLNNILNNWFKFLCLNDLSDFKGNLLNFINNLNNSLDSNNLGGNNHHKHSISSNSSNNSLPLPLPNYQLLPSINYSPNQTNLNVPTNSLSPPNSINSIPPSNSMPNLNLTHSNLPGMVPPPLTASFKNKDIMLPPILSPINKIQ